MYRRKRRRESAITVLPFFSNSDGPDEILGNPALLKAWGKGDELARDALAGKVYDELRRLARHHMKDERAGATLQTTALVNEVYLRLLDTSNIDWQHRGQFRAICSANDAANPGGTRRAPC